MKEKLITLLTFTSGLKSFGIKFIRVAILVVFVWIGGLKYFTTRQTASYLSWQTVRL